VELRSAVKHGPCVFGHFFAHGLVRFIICLAYGIERAKRETASAAYTLQPVYHGLSAVVKCYGIVGTAADTLPA
jgi:hypothetical protein